MTKTQKELHLTGWFRVFHGPVGAVPVQFFAMLHTGEYVYFRARGRKASLTISRHPSDAAPIRRFERFVRIDHPLGAGVMKEEQCVQMVIHWLGKYFTQLKREEPTLPREQRSDRQRSARRNRQHLLPCCA